MSKFKYTDGEKELNKVMKYNQELSDDIFKQMKSTRDSADKAIAESEELLRSLGLDNEVDKVKTKVNETAKTVSFSNKPVIESWDTILQEANARIPEPVELEDLLTAEEINAAFLEADRINEEFSRKTSIFNKTDLIFLAVATALQTVKSLLYPYIAQNFGYGKSFDASVREDHKFFEKEHRESAKKFRDKHQKKHQNGEWIEIAFRSVPYDAIKGSKNVLDVGLNGNDHRLRTLGHDPVLGWIFGTSNILTDTMTLNTFQTYRVSRNPLSVTPIQVTPVTLFNEAFEMIKADKMNLISALFAQAAHFKSDVYSKKGLPVPILSTLNESFATELYKSQYDSLCFTRDAKFVAGSAAISILFDMIIGIIHSFFYDPEVDSDKKIYEVRTRKILLISNIIASSSSVVAACITENPKQLDIGSLLVTTTHLFSDLRFIAKVKKEFIETEIQNRFQKEIDELDSLYNAMM